MAPHSSTLAWKILWTKEPGRLQSMGSLRVGYNWATSLSLFTFMHWRRKWQPIPVFLPGESQGRGELGGLPSVGSYRVGHDWSDLAAVIVEIEIKSQFKFRLLVKSSCNSIFTFTTFFSFLCLETCMTSKSKCGSLENELLSLLIGINLAGHG